MDWNEYKINILNNFENNINFSNQIENYVPPEGTKLHLPRQRMRKLLYNCIVLNKHIFEEVGYDIYQSKEQYDVTHKDIFDFIEECINLLVKKQQLN
jgi:hypothetical protein